MSTFKKFFLYNFIHLLFFYSFSNAEIIKDIKISGNDRISSDTILVFSEINIGNDLNDSDLNKILKNLYNTNFFDKISVAIEKGVLSIEVLELPLIQNIEITGVDAKKFKEMIIDNINLKSKNSFNKILLSKDVDIIKSQFKSMGFYFTKVEALVEKLDNNLINIEYNVDVGDKSKISKISFIGNKIFKNKKLKNIIISEEYKFWKFLSGKKYLKEQVINFDKRLLKNFYLNNGYYNVTIEDSFAKLINDNEFELIFNVNAGPKVFFNDLDMILPNDFDRTNYSELDKLFKNLKGKPYSINSVDDILSEVDKVTLREEFKSVNASLEETVKGDKLNINFVIKETEKFFVEQINIFGNNITRENVIRNQFDIDEGDPYSEILTNKTLNNIKSLNFFKNVDSDIIEGKNKNSKIINITVDEKPTGEIMAGAGGGTDGGVLTFGVKENNYLGKGLAVDANTQLSSETFKGELSVTNPNYNNSDKSLSLSVQAIEIDQLKKFGYKTKKNGFEVGTSFEYLEDLNLGVSTSTFVEKMETTSKASASRKKQAGNYLDTFLNLNLNYDKRNQKYKPTDGYFSNYNVKLPVISDNNTLTNSYNYKVFSELYENNISSFSILFQNATSVTGDDIKLTERLFVPSNKLRGFEKGKVGPKDGADFVGGNYLVSMNLQTTLPVIFENSQNLDALIFFDAANIWGVDYDSTIDDGDKIRSSAGIGVDWLTPIGPLNFSLSQVISKQASDIEESFRFNLGTTF